MKPILGWFALVLLLAGCSGPVGQKVEAPTSPPISAAPATPDTTDPEKAQAYRAQLTAAEEAYNKAKASNADPKVLVKAIVSYGTETMNSPLLAPKDKYPKALKLYAEALKIDPKNEEAKNNTELIIGIYKQMGKEPPKI